MRVLDILKQSNLPFLETELLLAFLLKKEREFLLTHPEFKLDFKTYQKYRYLEKKRLAGWSISVLIGSREFYGLKFIVNHQVLVPRPETELIVDKVLKLLTKSPAKSPYCKTTVIDLGTGSGAIIISLAKQLAKPNFKKNLSFKAVDISPQALKIARKNAKLHQQNQIIKFYQGNLLNPLLKLKQFKLLNNNIIITANLPYLSSSQIKKSPSITKEPRLALLAGSDGLKYYRILFKQIAILLKKSKKTGFIKILCEIDPGQKKSFTILQKTFIPKASLIIKKDLAKKISLSYYFTFLIK